MILLKNTKLNSKISEERYSTIINNFYSKSTVWSIDLKDNSLNSKFKKNFFNDTLSEKKLTFLNYIYKSITNKTISRSSCCSSSTLINNELKTQFLSMGEAKKLDEKVINGNYFDFSTLKKSFVALIKSISDKDSSLEIVSNNPMLDYKYTASITENEITFNKKSNFLSTELELNFDNNKLFLNKKLNKSSKGLFIKYFNQVINDLSMNKAIVKTYKKKLNN